MIIGIGTDIVAVERLARLYARHQERALEKLLADEERDSFSKASHAGRFLAKRFAAKEAFGKALGTGITPPASLNNIAILHDSLGKPFFRFAPALEALLAHRQLSAHLSISDEAEYALAFVILERI